MQFVYDTAFKMTYLMKFSYSQSLLQAVKDRFLFNELIFICRKGLAELLIVMVVVVVMIVDF